MFINTYCCKGNLLQIINGVLTTPKHLCYQSTHFFLFQGNCASVSEDGEDILTCIIHNSPAIPCRTISYTVTQGRDQVCLNGTFRNITENLEIFEGFGTSPSTCTLSIICTRCVFENITLEIAGNRTMTCIIIFTNVAMKKCRIVLFNTHVIFNNASLEQVLIEDKPFLTEKGKIQVRFENSELLCQDMRTCCLKLVHSYTVRLISLNSHLMYFKFQIDVSIVMFTLVDTTLFMSGIDILSRFPEYLRIPTIVKFHNVTVDNKNPSQAIPSYTMFNGSMDPSLNVQDTTIVLAITNPYIIIKDSCFIKSPIEIYSFTTRFAPVFFSVSLIRSTFMHSNNNGNGGALLVRSQVHNSRLIIFSCTFLNNSARKGFGDSTGRGGGLYVEAYSLELSMIGCTFRDNKASDLGQNLYTSLGVSVSLTDCNFQYNVKPGNQLQQALLFVSGRASLNDLRFQIINKIPDEYKGPVKVFYISGGDELNADISCPEWYQPTMQFTSISGASGLIEELRYECRPCSDNQYTTAKSNDHLSYTRNENHTLSDEANQNNICIKCPFGGRCTGNNVIARPNYWGYWHEGELKFQQCPAGYCCSGTDSSPCTMYNSCAGNRSGILCGICKESFSVSILEGKCTPNSKCQKDQWFWIFVPLIAFSYAMWYTFKDDIFAFLLAFTNKLKIIGNRKNVQATAPHGKLTSLVENGTEIVKGSIKVHKNSLKMITKKITWTDSRNSMEVVPLSSKDVKNNKNSDKGYFGIVIYFVQMAAEMKIEIEFSDVDKSEPFLDKILSNIKTFLNFDLRQVSFDACPLEGFTTVGKQIYRLIFLMGIYLSWPAVFVLTCMIIKIVQRQQNIEMLIRQLRQLKLKLVGGLIEIIKYCYSGICEVIFMSLVCVNIGTRYVWWYGANNTCLESWQIMTAIFATLYALPFPFALLRGMKLLNDGKISSSKFICCCLCPFSILHVIIQEGKTTGSDNHSNLLPLSVSARVIIAVLQGPYRQDSKHLTLYWEAMVCIRRLLITVMRLISYASIRMIIINILSSLFLIQHLYFFPFNVKTSNYVESLSLLLLLITSVINLLKASLTDSGVIPSGPSVQFFKGLETCERLFIMFIIIFIVFIELKQSSKKIQEKHQINKSINCKETEK